MKDSYNWSESKIADEICIPNYIFNLILEKKDWL